ncbi:MAG: hypothetical protein QOI03_1777, partial [Solirubrobacteraceae bacterium]|nr:hypothetical protein [Solirubrobacteraceae bacterium]
ALYSNLEALAHYDTAATFAEPGGTSAQRIAEKRGDVAFRLGRLELAIEAWEGCLAHHVERDEREQVAELHRKIGSALAHKGERKLAIEHHQRGINLVKDLPPSLALVRLYEEAAWLYMQVGDNMLAIYASEKALRLAESLGEVRAAGRAHGIFGRVFGRIGDKAKARENLERAVELARDSDAGETVLALLAQGHNLEHSEGDYDGAKGCYVEALELAEKIGDLPGQIELEAALGELAFHRCDWEELRRASDASAELAEREGLVGKLCLASALRGRLRWREGEWDAAESLFARAHELAGRAGLSEVSVEALMGLADTLRDRGDLAGAEATLEQALAICERAGLISQSVQAHAAMTQVLSVTERVPSAREAAEQAQTLAAQVHDPVSEACALEARGLVAQPVDALRALGEARAAWERLDRPLDIARCDVLLGRCLLDGDPSAAAEAFRRAGDRYAALGVDHLAKGAEEHAGLSRPSSPAQALPLRGGADAR